MKRIAMSRRRREQGVGMPSSSAGLMRFFQDEANGIKINPEFVIAGAFLLIISVVLANFYF